MLNKNEYFKFIYGGAISSIFFIVIYSITSYRSYNNSKLVILFLILVIFSELISWYGLCKFVNEIWKSIKNETVKMDSANPSWLLMIPVFNIYWGFKSIYGYSKIFNKIVIEKYPNIKKLKETNFIILSCVPLLLSIFGILIPLVNFFIVIIYLLFSFIVIKSTCFSVNEYINLKNSISNNYNSPISFTENINKDIIPFANNFKPINDISFNIDNFNDKNIEKNFLNNSSGKLKNNLVNSADFVSTLKKQKKLYDSNILSFTELSVFKKEYIQSINIFGIEESKEDFLLGISPLITEGVLSQEELSDIKSIISKKI